MKKINALVVALAFLSSVSVFANTGDQATAPVEPTTEQPANTDPTKAGTGTGHDQHAAATGEETPAGTKDAKKKKKAKKK